MLVSLGEHCNFLGGFAFKSQDLKDPEGIPVIKIKNVNNKVVKMNDVQFFSEEKMNEKLNKFLLADGDVLIAMTGQGSVGRVGRFRNLNNKKVLLNQRVGKFVPKQSLDLGYLYYILSSEKYEKILFNAASGSGQPNLSPDIIKSIKIPYLPIDEQIKVSKVLGALDDKIALNQKSNQTLEQMAQALFKSWFVDFDPVFDNALASGMSVNDFPEALQKKAEQRQQVQQQIANGELDARPLPEDIQQLFPSEFEQSDEPSIGINGWIPKGWEISDLAEITTELRRGISPKYTEEGGIQVINQKCIRNHEINFSLCRRNNPELRKVAGRELLIGDVLVNSTGVGTLGRVAQVHSLPEPTIVDSHVTVVRPNVEKILAYTFGQLMLANERSIEALGEGSTGQTELSRKILSEQKVVLPPVNLATKIEDTFKSYADKQVNNRVQIASLEKTRDTLLPKLISGELTIPTAKDCA
ncbi:restriction endonuclease subunit S [Thalassotalea castellviae]|uniref:Restriction endonuclease subunit S n=1 Tax=Thalassotalea castellviae TaxID=3075612 RepID=A0ABU2ZWC6_9GAMM|nr:restriction endonuclease subunit S [Thalassotalea sp. W431]MDT0602009.1 restriction endonuclease subunit S [Thalassotalea sp. W431]